MRTRVEWHGDKITAKVKAAHARGVFEGANKLLRASNERVPVDEHVLEGSGAVDMDWDKSEASVSYDTPYAVRLHEHPEYEFQNGREGKYLERTVNERGRDVRDHIARRMKEAL